ncbi:MAG: Glycerol-3-phosphate dehydrogenase [NAD(P)+] [Candidatus Anoxychlamydiales bacterium]|uniref:Glycerol-3-phosphate dehydrogenase NAD-dependent N-terminal domain-containing protein n=1 Tax=marine sediment metagenome TaxID=412755 RepID=A0A0F9KL32_9ZZZZ|nr:Glycerol-3-phosphate dehydrogenase [NAD(P)+] [Candidatus Anoxychlamydiales bacterium]NGX41332.1 Glycerol-3-phosphate dehydrogenase [NAD(P)+] [Candidatus Anoxychlamydiales bacterium]HEU64114.1 NAD(P)-dependent glycerol-3-phosphate dehydrogenase [Chlamydiota bacterium]
MKIGYLGAGAWGTALASLLANNSHTVIVWDRNPNNIKRLKETREHPKLKDFKIPNRVFYTDNILDAIKDVDMIVESVTSLGIRSVFSHIKNLIKINCPIVITSKGLEQNTHLLFPEILKEIFGEENAKYIGCLSGPSLADEVIKNHPTSVVSSSYSVQTMNLIAKAFNSSNFRVYPNDDILGVSFGGAMKNIIAIACGISDGLGFGDNAKAALMTRGLHEMKKLIPTKGGRPETLNGLSGMGDLCVTCLSKFSRNNQFGTLIAKGYNLKDAKGKIGMIVEGVYTCLSALQLARKYNIQTPITEAIKAVLYDNLEAKNVVKLLMLREIKQELE